MSDEKSQEKPTVPFDAPPKWAIDSFARVHEGIAAMEARVNTRMDERVAPLSDKLDACISGLKTVNGEVEALKKDHHEFKGETKARFDAGSLRAKSLSDTDEALKNDVKAVKAEMDESQMAKLIAAAAKTPQGQKVANALVGLMLLLIAAATLYLSAKVGLK